MPWFCPQQNAANSNTWDPPLSEDEEEELDLIQGRPPGSLRKKNLFKIMSHLFVGALIFYPKKNGVSSSSEAETGSFKSGFLRRFLVLQTHAAGETYMFCCVS